MDDKPILTTRKRLYAMRNQAADRAKDVPPWVWAAIMAMSILTIATIAVMSLRPREDA